MGIVAATLVVVAPVSPPPGEPAPQGARSGTPAQFALAAAHPDAVFVYVYGFTGGESTSDLHPGIGEADKVSSGLSVSGGRAKASVLTLNRQVDSYTTQFATKLSTGASIRRVTVFLMRGGSFPADIARYTLNSVTVRSQQLRFGADGSGVETVTLAFAQVKLTYWVQKEDGTLGAQFDYCWNFTTDTAC